METEENLSWIQMAAVQGDAQGPWAPVEAPEIDVRALAAAMVGVFGPERSIHAPAADFATTVEGFEAWMSMAVFASPALVESLDR